MMIYAKTICFSHTKCVSLIKPEITMTFLEPRCLLHFTVLLIYIADERFTQSHFIGGNIVKGFCFLFQNSQVPSGRINLFDGQSFIALAYSISSVHIFKLCIYTLTQEGYCNERVTIELVPIRCLQWAIRTSKLSFVLSITYLQTGIAPIYNIFNAWKGFIHCDECTRDVHYFTTWQCCKSFEFLAKWKWIESNTQCNVSTTWIHQSRSAELIRTWLRLVTKDWKWVIVWLLLIKPELHPIYICHEQQIIRLTDDSIGNVLIHFARIYSNVIATHFNTSWKSVNVSEYQD